MKSPNNLQKLIVCRRTFKKYPTIRYTIFEWNVTDNQNKAETASVENFSFLQATAYQLKLDYYFQKFRIRSLLFNWSSISRQVVGDMSVQIKERWSDYSFRIQLDSKFVQIRQSGRYTIVTIWAYECWVKGMNYFRNSKVWIIDLRFIFNFQETESEIRIKGDLVILAVF